MPMPLKASEMRYRVEKMRRRRQKRYEKVDSQAEVEEYKITLTPAPTDAAPPTTEAQEMPKLPWSMEKLETLNQRTGMK